MNKKIYMVPETATEQFLKTMGILMESSEFGKRDATDHPSGFHAPGRELFI